MTPEQQELFDGAILRVLDEQRSRMGQTLISLSHLMAKFGFPNPDRDLLADRLDYLVRKGLVEEVLKAVNRASRAWRITPAGIDYVDQH